MWKIINPVRRGVTLEGTKFDVIKLKCNNNHIFHYFSDLPQDKCKHANCGDKIPQFIQIQLKLLLCGK